MKKAIIAVAGLCLIGAVVFGNRLVPYAQTAYDNVVATVNDNVSLDFQIQAAHKQLDKIEPQIHKMVQSAAREKADIKTLERQLAEQSKTLKRQYDDMMALRSHLESGESVYVALNNQAYSNNRVEEDLGNRFKVYRTAEATFEKSNEILEIRKQALENALTKLDNAKAMQRELEVQIENLEARKSMIDIASSASNINMDDSQIARTQDMINELNAKLDAEEEMLNMLPEYTGSIPVSSTSEASGDVLKQMDAYFNKIDESEVVVK